MPPIITLIPQKIINTNKTQFLLSSGKKALGMAGSDLKIALGLEKSNWKIRGRTDTIK